MTNCVVAINIYGTQIHLCVQYEACKPNCIVTLGINDKTNIS